MNLINSLERLGSQNLTSISSQQPFQAQLAETWRDKLDSEMLVARLGTLQVQAYPTQLGLDIP
jgi:hypothetical protein